MPKQSKKDVKANDHESYGSYTLISVLIPIAGFILGIIYLTKDKKIDKKLGEHLLAVSILASIAAGILFSLFGGSFFISDSTLTAPITTTEITSDAPTPPKPAGPQTSIEEGIYEVKIDIKPGKYKTGGGEGCYYARLSSLTGDGDNIIANNISNGPAVVEILSTDKAFQTSGCDTWKIVK